jgi:hypothetical protein
MIAESNKISTFTYQALEELKTIDPEKALKTCLELAKHEAKLKSREKMLEA